MSDPKNFLLNSDYPIDKVIKVVSGSFTANANDWIIVNIPHNLPELPLIIPQWSTTPDFSIVYDNDSGLPSTYQHFGFLDLRVRSFVAGGNVRITADSFLASPTTIYYRIICLDQANSGKDYQPTASTTDSFVLNTDYNYLKLAKSGKVAVTADPTVVHHGLGYKPKVMLWLDYDQMGVRQIEPLSNSTTDSGDPYPYYSYQYVTNTEIGVNGYSNWSATLHYRLYYDEA